MFWGLLRLLIVILVSFKFMTAVFDRRPLGSMGLAFHSRWWKELAHGLAVGGVMLSAAVALEWCCGFAGFPIVPHPVAWAGLSGFVLFAVAATNEEAIFRGYPFQCLVASITPLGAILVTSAFFGAAHLGNPHRTWISTINTMLVGVPFAIAYLRTRSLWMPIGMHFIWNFLLDFVFGLPVERPQHDRQRSHPKGAWTDLVDRRRLRSGREPACDHRNFARHRVPGVRKKHLYE